MSLVLTPLSLPSTPDAYRIDVTAGASGAVANDSTKAVANQAAFTAAIASAKTLGGNVYIPGSGVFYLSKYLDVNGARNLKFRTDGSPILRFPSDDVSVGTDSIATSTAMARSAIVVRNSVGVIIENIGFQGGTNQSILQNCGCAVYARNSIGLTIFNPRLRGGFAVLNQDNQEDTNGVGTSLTAAAGSVTLVASGAAFHAGLVGQVITLSNITNQVNGGAKLITSCPNATTLTYDDADAISETSAFRYTLNDGDRNTTIIGGSSDGVRGCVSIANHSKIVQHHWDYPMNRDVCGIGMTLTIVGTTITLFDPTNPFLPAHDGKYIKVAGTTTAANSTTAKLTYISSSSVSFTNNNGGLVSENFPTNGTGTWWILNGDKTAIGAGAGALSEAGAVLTVKTATNVFAPSDVGKSLRINGATTSGFNTQGAIIAYTSPTQVDVDIPGTVGSEAFTGVITVDGYDHSTYGSTQGGTHAIYIFGASNAAHGRTNILIDGCTFRGNRTTCVKASGSSAPIRDLMIVNCHAFDCGVFALCGADDAQEHSNITIHNNTIVDCSTQRSGWDTSSTISVLGAKGVTITHNKFYYTRNHISSVAGGANSTTGIAVSRYVAGMSQPVEDVTIAFNKFTALPSRTTPASIFSGYAITLTHVGLRAKYRTGGTLTKNGNTMTLTDSSGIFAVEDIGKTVTFVNSSNGANDGAYTITAANSTTFNFVNAAGVVGALGGTYRIPPRTNHRGGSCVVRGNEIINVGGAGITSTSCVAPDFVGNTFSGLAGDIHLAGDLAPRISGTRQNGAGTTGACFRLAAGTSWPHLEDNLSTNGALGLSFTRDIGVAVSGSTAVDFPLQGKCGRAATSDGKEEVVIPYGSLPVDGDTLNVNGTVLTYKASSPGALQFNSLASLLTLLNAISGVTAADYGASFADNVTTQHIRIRKTTASANTDGAGLDVIATTLNPTFLPAPRNGNTSSHTAGRGSGSAGPTADKVVVWSPATTMAGQVLLTPDNAAAQTLLQASGYRPLKSANDPGSCELMQLGTTAGTEVFRWSVAS